MKSESYSHIGKKKVNEDYVQSSDNIFIVCDGVGGEVSGDVASREVANSIFKQTQNNELKLTKDEIEAIVSNSQKHLNILIQENEELEGMSTTLAAVFISEKGFFITHIGDSRVYLIRPSDNVFWQTWDHSLVGNLVKNGEISREAGRNHPMNNQIFKAIKANFKNKISNPEIHFVTDIRKDDILFICSDGVSEAFSDLDLLELLANKDRNLKEKLEIIKKGCIEKSFDNNTAIVCSVENKDLPNSTIIPLEWISIDSLQENLDLDNVILDDVTTEEELQPKKKKWFNFFK
ncbi:PP2C family protein-serine/threonine phosphatase [Bizionia arctica]|uniref:Protein phosphatase n=1 Tax=Bizionia arctica TaxID=1495645 RepID=A0A917GH63_9FLAO|nr:protein phosphatase 2C domain-containing protein [Bizionia arctica]GGG44958.1 protein phosphatase [Bizionia arctica]